MIAPLMHYSGNNNSQDVDTGTLNLLKEQHQFLTSVLDEVIDPILVIGTDFKVKFANKAACNFANDKGCFQVTEPRCHKLIFNSNLPCSSFGKACPLIEVLESDETAVIESEHTMPNGTTSLFEIKASPLFNHDGESLGIVESFRDITDRKEYATILQNGHKELEARVASRTKELTKSNKKLADQLKNQKKADNIIRSQRDKFQCMLTAIKQGIHIVNSEYEIEFQNKVMIDACGDSLDNKCYRVYLGMDSPCVDCLMHKAIQTNTVQSAGEIVIKDRFYSRSCAPFTDTDKKKKCLILFNDITEEKAYQAQKIHTSQLASIGELSASVAHEINNPINGIINYAQILLDDTEEEDTSFLLGRIIKEGKRIAKIVSSLLAFARQDGADTEAFQETYIQEVLDDSLTLLRHQLEKDGIDIQINLQTNDSPVWVHPQQLEQVIVNVLSNARHALNEKYPGHEKGKCLDINSQIVEKDETSYIRLSLKDLGGGIPQEIINNVCTPFFSTKKEGEGTGLGLSISQGFIKKFNGSLQINSNPGVSTEIVIDLPVKKL
jgi:signal transduction histidine kinase